MVVVGATDVEPAATGVTAPILLSIVNEEAFVVFQVSVEEPPSKNAPMPDVSEVGLAVRMQVGAGAGSGGALTVTIVEQVTEPPAPIAVPV